jgi:hypothetical protein
VIRHGSEVENTSSQEGDSVMQARIKNPAMVIPGAVELLQSLAKASEQGGRAKEDTRSCSPAGESDQWLQRMR